MAPHTDHFLIFLGRFHPVLVHLPIGTMLMVGLLEFLSVTKRFNGVAQNTRLLLGLAVLSALGAATLGLMLSRSGDYDGALVRQHQWLGLAFVGGGLVCWWLSGRERRLTYRLGLGVTIGLLCIASHLGGSITHGRGYLTQYAPRWIQSMVADRSVAKEGYPDSFNQPNKGVFDKAIQPILNQRCSSCHGPEKQKGGLRLDSLSALVQGGKGGPIIVAGRSLDSRLILRIRMSPGEDDHMPPRGKPQLTDAEIELLTWWVDLGAPNTVRVASLKRGEETHARPPLAGPD